MVLLFKLYLIYRTLRHSVPKFECESVSRKMGFTLLLLLLLL